ncbi:MAG: BlaI/MecI/CopY family transcriptional regulator [Candidatus Zixiibacteriota bacterium]|nr:MAG: BlaI/MecI/CopY family transcriptional regulator [candidate division Zixibacteria bacterium]
MAGSGFHFDPAASGTAVFLGPAEARLMEIAWTRGALTVKQAMFYMGPDSQLAYTTVQTTLGRLCDKKLLKKTKTGRILEYRPAGTREEFLKKKVNLVIACLKANFSSVLEG